MLPLGGFTEMPDLLKSGKKQNKNNINNTTVSTATTYNGPNVT